MKEILIISALVTALIFLPYNSGSDKNIDTCRQTKTNTATTIPDFTKSFEGTINGKYGIIMNLAKSEKKLSGTYIYKSQGKPIKISGTIDDNGNLTINEFNDKGIRTGVFKGQLSGNIITGQWTRPDGSRTMPFSISEPANTKTSAASNKVICTEKETKDEDGGEDPVITKTCLYKNYKTISKGYPDYKGRYSYEYSLFSKQADGSYVQIENASLFNQYQNELLSLINSEIEKVYDSDSIDPETKDCFDGEPFAPFSFEQMGIDFEDDKINFNVTFGLSGACMSVDGTTVSFSLDEIKRYLNE